MPTTIRTTLLGFFVLVCIQVHSQNRVTYGYDNAGNRVSRTITIAPLQPAPALAPAQKGDPEGEVYSEVLSGIQIHIYPNPTDGLLKVEILNLPEGQPAELRLYNLSGRLLSTQQAVGETTPVDISDQPAGIYVLKITAGQYRTEWRIIKK
jgi:hypothetical protein